MSYTELVALVLGTGFVAVFACALLHRMVHRDTFRRYHEVGYAVFLQLGVIFAVLLAFVFNNSMLAASGLPLSVQFVGRYFA